MTHTREVPLNAGECALLVIDMQKYCALLRVGHHQDLDALSMTDQQKFVCWYR